MTDEQIITYVSEGVAAGKSERQIGTELISKGVSSTQLQRILREYRSGSIKPNNDENSTRMLSSSRPERKVTNGEEIPSSTPKSKETVESKNGKAEKTDNTDKKGFIVCFCS